MTTILNRSLTAAAALALLAAPVAFAGDAAASGGTSKVVSSGACTGGGTFKLAAKHDDGRIEVEYEVDSNRAGQVWTVRVTDNTRLVLSRQVTTTAPSGSFTVRKSIANLAGLDRVHARATFRDRVCGGTVTL